MRKCVVGRRLKLALAGLFGLICFDFVRPRWEVIQMRVDADSNASKELMIYHERL